MLKFDKCCIQRGNLTVCNHRVLALNQLQYIPRRQGLIRERSWRITIYDSIRFKLATYDKLRDYPALLEVAIWRSQITERYFGLNKNRFVTKRTKLHSDDSVYLQCRIDSIAIVTIIIPNVFSLTDGNIGNDAFVVWDGYYSYYGYEYYDPDNYSEDSDENDEDANGD